MSVSNMEAVVLRNYTINETDVILVLYTSLGGKVRAIAKQGKEEHNRFHNFIQPFSYGVVQLKNNPKGLSLLLQVEPQRRFGQLTKSVEKIACASYFCELLELFAPEGESDDNLFSLLHLYLHHMADALLPQVATIQGAFELALLKLSGFGLMLAQCVLCGNTHDLIKLSALEGGALCTKCADTQGVRISFAVWRELKALNAYDISRPIPLVTSTATLDVLDQALHAILERQPKSFGFYQQIMVHPT